MTSPVPAIVVRGHRVASGTNGDPRFPGGTIRMQVPHFRERGLDLSAYYPATLNVNISTWRYRVIQPRQTFSSVKWHPTEPAEDFSFFDAVVGVDGATSIPGLIYYPHPATKPEHFQQPDVLELLLPWIDGIDYGTKLTLEVPHEQMTFEE
jgi:hypothetical protein